MVVPAPVLVDRDLCFGFALIVFFAAGLGCAIVSAEGGKESGCAAIVRAEAR